MKQCEHCGTLTGLHGFSFDSKTIKTPKCKCGMSIESCEQAKVDFPLDWRCDATM